MSGDALIIARWPASGQAVDEGALSAFEALKGVVRAVRNARAEYGVEEKRKVAATLVVQGDAALSEALTAELQVSCQMTLQSSQAEVKVRRRTPPLD